jgi:L-alanine-DL-glutamate epimerase-like enolase superfamily enzyme
VKITGVESVAINVPIHADKATVGARGMHASSPFLILQVHTDEGLTGLGEVSCTPLWSGEDQDSAAHFVHTLLEPELVGQDPRELTTLSHRMHKVLANNPFTRAGIEMALWDLMGKRAGQPLHMLLGGPVRESVRTKYSVSGLEPVAAAAIASWAVEQGFTSMKVKVGMDLDTDLRRVREVRRVVGPEVLLGVDANGGWDPSTALRALPHLEDMNIAFIEQPVQSGNPRGLARIRAAAKVPIVADESLATSHDALSLIAHDAADVFSIYVGMGGGIREAVTIAAIAEAAWTPCTIGSNLELGIAQAAMIHLAVSQPAIRPDIVPCDIISRYFYEQDIVQEPLPVASGVAHRIDKPGLGIELDMTAIERFRVA